MPHYFFHLKQGSRVSPDREGTDLSDGKEARIKAMSTAREVVCDELLHGEPLNLEREYEITDGEGQGVMTVTFAMALRSRRPNGPSH